MVTEAIRATAAAATGARAATAVVEVATGVAAATGAVSSPWPLVPDLSDREDIARCGWPGCGRRGFGRAGRRTACENHILWMTSAFLLAATATCAVIDVVAS